MSSVTTGAGGPTAQALKAASGMVRVLVKWSFWKPALLPGTVVGKSCMYQLSLHQITLEVSFQAREPQYIFNSLGLLLELWPSTNL